MPAKPIASLPPHRTSLDTPIPPSQAQSNLCTYLTLSASQPHLHPNSTLSNLGISFSIDTGPEGGIALHQLKRIEAGLRGEVLEPETREELEERFGPLELNAEIDEYNAGSKKRKRRDVRMKEEEIELWSSDVGATIPKEIESFANTPLYTPVHEDIDAHGWQDLKGWEQQQEVWEREMGVRDQAVTGQQIGAIPDVKVEGTERTGEQKEERKRRKKAKREELRREKARKAGV